MPFQVSIDVFHSLLVCFISGSLLFFIVRKENSTYRSRCNYLVDSCYCCRMDCYADCYNLNASDHRWSLVDSCNRSCRCYPNYCCRRPDWGGCFDSSVMDLDGSYLDCSDSNLGCHLNTHVHTQWNELNSLNFLSNTPVYIYTVI